MTDSTKLKIRYGRQNFPDGVKAVWGARMIWPNDLVPDRQDLDAVDDEHKQELIAWLNGTPEGTGALHKARQALRDPYSLGLLTNGDNEEVIYEDDKGKIIGSAQSSYGYVYVCGFLHKHVGEPSES